MSEIITKTCTITTTGTAGNATGSGTIAGVNGFLLDIYLNFHASAPNTTDTTIAYDEPDLGNVLVVANSATDGRYYPRAQACDAAGAPLAGVYEHLPISGGLSIAVAGCDALAGAVVVTVRYLQV